MIIINNVFNVTRHLNNAFRTLLWCTVIFVNVFCGYDVVVLTNFNLFFIFAYYLQAKFDVTRSLSMLALNL